jgi:PmbA protein
MSDKNTAKLCLESLKRAGAQKAQCLLAKSAKHELNVEAGKISLLRTTFNTEIRLTAIKDKRRGTTTLNGDEKSAIEKAAKNAVEFTQASPQDESYDISETQPAQIFDNGLVAPDTGKMFERLEEYLLQSKKAYPKTIQEQSILSFTRTTEYLLNSNGVEFESSQGVYSFFPVFTTKDGKKSSSFNYSIASFKTLEKDLLSCSSINALLSQSAEQLDTKPVPGKFTGDIIVTPDCLGDFLGFITDMAIRDGMLIAGTSVYKDKLGEQIASTGLTVHSKPVSGEIAEGYFVTPDGYKAENLTIIDKGVLKTFILSLYGARKTNLKRVSNSGNCYVVAPGDKSFDEMVKSVKKGLLVARFSGGRPNENGDFSGIAKNSYYIENGKIQSPVSETMISGNIPQMFLNITGISKERVDFGTQILPWISFGAISISGK